MIRLVKFILTSIIFVFLVFFLADFFYFSGWHENLQSQREVGEWIGREFQFKTDVFVFRFDDTGNYAVDAPKYTSMLPSSIKEYLVKPNNWQFEDGNAFKGWGRQDGVEKFDWVRPIPAGTCFKVTGVYKFTKPLVGKFLDIYIKIDGSAVDNLKINGNSLFTFEFDFENKNRDFIIKGFKEDIIEPVSNLQM